MAEGGQPKAKNAWLWGCKDLADVSSCLHAAAVAVIKSGAVATCSMCCTSTKDVLHNAVTLLKGVHLII